MTYQTVFLNFVKTFALAAVLIAGGSVSAQAGNAQIIFGGTVSKPTHQNGIREYPQTVVSFGSQALLPTDVFGTKQNQIRAFDESGRRLSGTQAHLISVGSNQSAGKIVNLGAQAHQTFILCAGSKANCIRYRVAKY